MDPQIVMLILQHNGADVKAIVEKVGLDNLIALAPHFGAILKTLDQAKTEKVR